MGVTNTPKFAFAEILIACAISFDGIRSNGRGTLMKAGIRKRLAAAAAVLSVSAALLVSAPGNGSAASATPSLRAFGITGDGTLMATFTTDRPNVLDWVRAVTGLSGDTKLLALDHRVQNGLMYGLGDKGGIYTIKTPPQTSDVVVTKVSQLQVALYGTNFGFDFNPAADRLRVVSDNGQNLRHNLNDHTTVEDTTLTTPPLTGPTRGVTASGYTNNDLVASTGTLLYGIDTTTDNLVLQAASQQRHADHGRLPRLRRTAQRGPGHLQLPDQRQDDVGRRVRLAHPVRREQPDALQHQPRHR